MKCKKCGYENNGNSKYCVKCGEDLTPTPAKDNTKNYKVLILILAILLAISAAYIFSADFKTSNETIFNTDDVSELDIEKTEVNISNVTFYTPAKGEFKGPTVYYFNFSNFTCSINKVSHYETSNSTRNIEKTTFSKDYPGCEYYVLKQNNMIWHGIKIKKDNQWFHIAMKTHNNMDVINLMDWMYAENDWDGHE